MLTHSHIIIMNHRDCSSVHIEREIVRTCSKALLHAPDIVMGDIPHFLKDPSKASFQSVHIMMEISDDAISLYAHYILYVHTTFSVCIQCDQIWQNFKNSLTISCDTIQYLAKIVSISCQIFYTFGQIFVVLNGQLLKIKQPSGHTVCKLSSLCPKRNESPTRESGNLSGLFFIGEGENFERAGVAISVVIFLLLVAAVGQQVPRRMPGHRERW